MACDVLPVALFYMNRLVELDKLKQLSRKQERKEAVSTKSIEQSCNNKIHNLSSVGAGGRSRHSGDHAKQQQGRNYGEVHQGFLQKTTTQISQHR